MGKLTLVTSNLHKLEEFKRFGIKDIDIAKGLDLREIEHENSMTVTIYKALEAGKGKIVEDTSLIIKGENVGTNIRWMLDDMDNHVGKEASWIVWLGLNDGESVRLYAGRTNGKIVKASSEGFGFDPMFAPTGSSKTLAQLGNRKDMYSARRKAVECLMLDDYRRKVIIKSIKPWDGKYQD